MQLSDMQRCSRDNTLLDLNKISSHEHNYGKDKQLILHLVMFVLCFWLERQIII